MDVAGCQTRRVQFLCHRGVQINRRASEAKILPGTVVLQVVVCLEEEEEVVVVVVVVVVYLEGACLEAVPHRRKSRRKQTQLLGSRPDRH